jgi:hypothetical protein
MNNDEHANDSSQSADRHPSTLGIFEASDTIQIIPLRFDFSRCLKDVSMSVLKSVMKTTLTRILLRFAKVLTG